MQLYQKAAEKGDWNAQYEMGVRYEEGNGVPKNIEKAIFWYQKAAEEYHQAAMARLGKIYDKGELVPRNSKKALHWYQKAIQRGGSTELHNAVRRLEKELKH